MVLQEAMELLDRKDRKVPAVHKALPGL